MTWSGLSGLYMLVFASKLNGKNIATSSLYLCNGFLVYEFGIFVKGGMPSDFCILTLWPLTITYLSGMKTSELSILMLKSESLVTK